ncbi:MAG TPA: NAD-dependent epimerase/dehydratase family protein, partial [Dongiaceae bacterium]|nr:NAD-dependent epimerase/dehydratase family protein [Dongiaceae bacterium]
EGAVAGCERALHAAALLNSVASFTRFHRINVLGTTNVCQATLAAGIQRLVVVSTSDVFGIPKPGQVLDEYCPLQPWGEPYADTKIEAVQTVRHYRDQQGLPATLVYPGWVYGPGDRQFFPAVLDMVRDRHVFTWEKAKPYEINLTYIDDLVDALLRCLLSHEQNGEYLILDTNTGTTPKQLFQTLADQVGQPISLHHLPYPLMMLVAACSQWLARRGLIAKPLLSTTDVKAFGNEFHFSNRRAAEELGWRPTTPVAVGLRNSMEWQARRRENPDLVG